MSPPSVVDFSREITGDLAGDPPFVPRGCIAQAWTVAEVLRAWHATASLRKRARGPRSQED